MSDGVVWVGSHGTPGRNKAQAWLSASHEWFARTLGDPGRWFPRAVHCADGYFATARVGERQVLARVTLEQLATESAAPEAAGKERRFAVVRVFSLPVPVVVEHAARLSNALRRLDWTAVPSTIRVEDLLGAPNDADGFGAVGRRLPALAGLTAERASGSGPYVCCLPDVTDVGDLIRLAVLWSQFQSGAGTVVGRVAVLQELPSMPDPTFFAGEWASILASMPARGGALVEWRKVASIDTERGVSLLGRQNDFTRQDSDRLVRRALAQARGAAAGLGIPLRWFDVWKLSDHEWQEQMALWRDDPDEAGLLRTVEGLASTGGKQATSRLTDIAVDFESSPAGHRAACWLAKICEVAPAEIETMEAVQSTGREP